MWNGMRGSGRKWSKGDLKAQRFQHSDCASFFLLLVFLEEEIATQLGKAFFRLLHEVINPYAAAVRT